MEILLPDTEVCVVDAQARFKRRANHEKQWPGADDIGLGPGFRPGASQAPALWRHEIFFTRPELEILPEGLEP
jgi:hypothetical protein